MLSANLQSILLVFGVFLMLTITGCTCYYLGRRVGTLEKQLNVHKTPTKIFPLTMRSLNLDPIVPGEGDEVIARSHR